MLRLAGVDRVHSHFANSGATVAMLAAHHLELPWSLTLHGISETDGAAGMLLPAKLERAEFAACASWFMRAQAMRVTTPKHWTKFHVIRCGVDISELPSTGRIGSNQPLRLITVGRLSPEKGYAGLLYAVSKLVGWGIDFKITIVGEGPLRTAIQYQANELGLKDRLELKGAIAEDETLAEIGASDVFVLASLMEGLPVVLMEALALGKPVVAPSVAGIPELVTDGLNGLLFRPSDWEDLAEKIAHLAKDESARQGMSDRAYATVANEFDINVAVGPLAILFSGGDGHTAEKDITDAVPTSGELG
jgi:colanic acid/amylovoran biosynthesis glycosyltransferase